MEKSSQRNIIIVTCFMMIIIVMILTPYRKPPVQPVPFCTLLPSSIEYVLERQNKLVVDREVTWQKGKTLRVYFFGGTPEIKKEVLKIINEWTIVTDIKFKEVYDLYDSTEVRVSFNCAGYSSLVGTQSFDKAYQNKPTMCLQGLDTTVDKLLFKRTVLHEFGHVLGFLHELQSPAAKIPWDTAKLYRYYDSLYKWKPDSVYKWVLKLYEGMDATDFDTLSIMLYAVPREVTKGGYFIKWPNKLSSTDKQKAHDIYH